MIKWWSLNNTYKDSVNKRNEFFHKLTYGSDSCVEDLEPYYFTQVQNLLSTFRAYYPDLEPYYFAQVQNIAYAKERFRTILFYMGTKTDIKRVRPNKRKERV